MQRRRRFIGNYYPKRRQTSVVLNYAAILLATGFFETLGSWSADACAPSSLRPSRPGSGSMPRQAAAERYATADVHSCARWGVSCASQDESPSLARPPQLNNDYPVPKPLIVRRQAVAAKERTCLLIKGPYVERESSGSTSSAPPGAPRPKRTADAQPAERRGGCEDDLRRTTSRGVLACSFRHVAAY